MQVVTQTRLVNFALNTPRPLDRSDYVSVLFAKAGELRALRHVDDATRDHLRPLIQVLWDEREEPTATKLDGRMHEIAEAARAHPVYLDLLRVTTRGKAIPEHDLDVVRRAHSTARSDLLSFIPVIRAGEMEARTLEAIRTATGTDRRGVGIRYRFQTLFPPPGRTRRDVLLEACAAVGCAPAACDLLLDLDLLNQWHDYPAADIAGSINELMAVGAWRSVILLGSTMPATLADIEEGTVTSLPRLEWELWKDMDVPLLDRPVVFGDYGVQGPCPPAGGGFDKMRASVRYTAGKHIHVARGTGPIKEQGREQYRTLCRWITEREDYSGPQYTHGDLVLHECGHGLRPLGRQDMWREAATSHHLRYVVEQIATRVRPGPSQWVDIDDYALGRV
jgi:hypothetical protein